LVGARRRANEGGAEKVSKCLMERRISSAIVRLGEASRTNSANVAEKNLRSLGALGHGRDTWSVVFVGSPGDGRLEISEKFRTDRANHGGRSAHRLQILQMFRGVARLGLGSGNGNTADTS